MPRKPTLTCATCSKPMWVGRGTLPQGQARCRDCRCEPVDPHPCGICSRETTNPLFCSRACAGLSRQAECEVCGARFARKNNKGVQQRTCSRACGVVLRRMDGVDPWPQSPVRWRQCPACGSWSTTRAGKVCGCQPSSRYQRVSGTSVTRHCEACTNPFEYVMCGGLPAQFCPSCRAERKRDQQRDNRRRRRARQRGAQTEPVNVRKVYERDRWRCGLCGKRVDRRLLYPHPMSASLDHVLPLSLGGAHSMANVQLAHLECNHAKSNGGSQQLALVG